MSEKNTFKSIKEIVNGYERCQENLIPILTEIQSISLNNYISEDDISIVAKELNIHESIVFEVATFYSMLSTKTRGKFIIELCKSAPCHVSKSEEIAGIFKELLGISIGETTLDGRITLQYTSCVGACDIGPVAKIGEKVYGNLTRDKIVDIINTCRRDENV